MKYAYKVVHGLNDDLMKKITILGSDGWRLHTMHINDGTWGEWTAIMEKVTGDDGTRRKVLDD